MSSREENVALVQSCLDAFARGDIEFARQYIHPDADVTSNPLGINSGVYRGYDGYLKWLGQWLEAWETFEIEVEDVVPVGSRHIVVVVQQRGVGRGSGVAVDQRLGQMWELRDGQIRAFHLYPSREEAVEAARGREDEPPD